MNNLYNILVIIDMQETFYETARSKRTIAECQRLIKKFKHRNEPIVVLEYLTWGETIPEITSLLKDSKHLVLKKNLDDGSVALDRKFHKQKKNIRFVVAGVNIGACVMDTVCGLIKKGYHVKVIRKACNGYRGDRSWHPVRRYRKLAKERGQELVLA